MLRGGDPPTPEESGSAAPSPTVARSGSTSDRRVLSALGDAAALEILVALSAGERDVHSLVLQTGLPQSSVYRKLRELADGDVVSIGRFAFTPEGRKVELFRSRVREVRIGFAAGRLRVAVLRPEDGPDRIQQMWDDVRRYGR